MAAALAAERIMDKPIKRINFNWNARSSQNEQIIGDFIERELGELEGLRSRDGDGYNRSFLATWIGQQYAKMLFSGDAQKPYRVQVLSPQKVLTASRLYRQMVYVDQGFQKTTLYVASAAQDDWIFLWKYLKAFERAHQIEIPDLDAPQGDRRNLRMIIWMLLEITARMIERDEFVIQR